MTRDARHRAAYDKDGNIILFSDQTEADTGSWAEIEEAITAPPINIPAVDEDLNWKEPSMEKKTEDSITCMAGEKEVPVTIIHATRKTKDFLDEGVRQYASSMHPGKPFLRNMAGECNRFFRRSWGFLSQPVWVPAKKNAVRQYSRGTLFLMDIVRFGGTFALIFAGLFVALNYQSFWEITSSNINHMISSPSVNSREQDEAAMTTDSLAVAVSAAAEDGDLFSYLPTVGPPENRIIIPKMRLNVPLVTPSYEALLRQDWTQVETDIQASLQNGVVHYPGTAKPGQAGNFFVTGHSSYYPWAPGEFKTVFARLHELEPGDEYWVYYNGDKHRYVVRSKKEVSPSDITVLDQPSSERIATLMTCTPVGTTLRRLIVKAEEVDPVSGIALKVGERTGEQVVPKVSLEALPI